MTMLHNERLFSSQTIAILVIFIIWFEKDVRHFGASKGKYFLNRNTLYLYQLLLFVNIAQDDGVHISCAGNSMLYAPKCHSIQQMKSRNIYYMG